MGKPSLLQFYRDSKLYDLGRHIVRRFGFAARRGFQIT
jgi:hypothetical protein